ncbi:MAG: hypothetical protein L6Q35_00435, partial [Phycisphaerales bacterium]|nr:hypothetical protein [Phycisphaerales bacterium]
MLLTSAVFGAIAPCAPAGPVSTPWGSTTGSSAVAAAGVAGRYATADAATDAVTIRNIDESVVRTISRAEITSLLPWM